MIDVVGNFFAYWYGSLEKIPYFCGALSINRSMQLIHRIAHLFSRLLAVGSAYIYIYIYQVVTRFYLNKKLNMGYAYISPMVLEAHLRGVTSQTSILHHIIGDEPQAVWSVKSNAHGVRRA